MMNIAMNQAGEIFRVGDKIVTIYDTPAIKPMVIEAIKYDDNVAGGIALKGQGVITAITIAKHVNK